MDDLISRKAAIEAVHEEFDECLVWDESGKCTADEVEIILEALPSAQPEIIRCKDCKFYEIYELKADNTDDKRYKPSVCVKGKFAVKRRADWYCADAERRTDE